MIDCILTIDYEIYGNGEGALQDLVYEPMQRLMAVLDEAEAKCVVFVEAAELERIEEAQSDLAIGHVKRQVKELHDRGIEIGLHLHPQWYGGRYSNGKWDLDFSEYNLCTLSGKRITAIVDQAIAYLRLLLGVPDFTPFSFRAGNWLFQPSSTAAAVLTEHGIRVDSSVFKGGLQRKHGLDYRHAPKKEYYWKFQDDVTRSEGNGTLLEIPIHSRMVPFWKMLERKRIALQSNAPSAQRTRVRKPDRLLDFCRLRYPQKLDFCRMTLKELTGMVASVIREDEKAPTACRPLVAIGHTKDLTDLDTVRSFLLFLRERGIAVSTLSAIYDKCRQE